MSRKDLTKELLYEGVKTLVETPANHIHLKQQKLYTLYSLAFNYLLYRSGTDPGHYIIRIEDSFLMDKITRKAKDETSRKFLNKMALPRKLKYGNSMFHIDFFSFTTWANTNDLSKEKVKGALIVKNATKSPIGHDFVEDEEVQSALNSLPKDYYHSSLKEFVPKTITIAFEEDFDDCEEVAFPFIQEEPSEKVARGVNIASDIDLNDMDEY